MKGDPILCLDFDGVIHSYTSGWQGATTIPDLPVKGAFDFIFEAMKHFDVRIYSSRSKEPGGIKAMQQWFYENDFMPWTKLGWPESKPSAFLTIDDRAIQFTGTFPKIEELKQFKPWYKS